jgi:hypothetical protein
VQALSGVKAGQKLLKGVPKNYFWNSNIFNLKSKGKMEKFLIYSFGLN